MSWHGTCLEDTQSWGLGESLCSQVITRSFLFLPSHGQVGSWEKGRAAPATTSSWLCLLLTDPMALTTSVDFSKLPSAFRQNVCKTSTPSVIQLL